MKSWTEASIGAWLCRNTFQRKLLVVPNCNWTGNECDLLCVAPCLRIIDVEIKISRADLKADRDKEKWWDRGFGTMVAGKWVRPPATARQWPRRVWKHYYAMPADIWKQELLDAIPPSSGVLLCRGEGRTALIESIRKAKPNKDAKPISAADAIDIARLAGLRMWDAYETVERVRRDAKRMANAGVAA